MTKKSILERNKKRIKLVEKYKNVRLKIKNIIKDPSISYKIRWNAILSLQKLPRDSSKSRIRNRCFITGRGRSYIRKFGLSRIKLRELSELGLIPGLKKSSW